jgi:hypothetical protein
MGREEELRLLSLHGLYYLADSAPCAVKTHFPSQIGGGGEVKRRELNTILLFYKVQFVKKKRAAVRGK